MYYPEIIPHQKSVNAFLSKVFTNTFVVALLFLLTLSVSAQSLDISSCPTMVKRSNGNGQASSAPGDFRPQSAQNNPVAPNVTGTPYQLVPFLPSTKTGDIHFKWTSGTAINNIPVITRVWLTATGTDNAVLSNIRFGPPTVSVPSAPNYYVDYSFYGNNMPNAGRITLEFTNPQTGAAAFTCSYDLGSNATAATPVLDCTPIINTQPSNLILCGGATAVFSVVATGATSYQWQVSSDGTIFSNITNGGVYNGATSASLSVATPTTNNGKYYRVVLSAAGCPSVTSTSARLVAYTAPTAVFNGPSAYCGFGDRSLGIAFTGTAPFSFTYTLAGTPTTVNNINSSPYYISVSPISTSTVDITSVSDANCTINAPTGNTSVSINAFPTITPTNALACFGGSSFSLPFTSTGSANQFSITAGVRAMPGFVTITNASYSASPISVTIPSSGVPTGTYDFNISIRSSVTGCGSSTVPFTVTVNALPVVSASASSSNVCVGTNVNLLAAPANLSAYSWTASPSTTISPVFNPTVTTVANTIYTVTGTDANGCSASGSVSVNTIAGPSLSVTASAPGVCNGGSSFLTASGGSTYSWSPAAGLTATQGATVIATPSVTTTYTVLSQNNSGCASSGSVTVTATTPSVTITNSSPTVCSGNISTLTATAGLTTYVWSPLTGLFTDAAATTAYTGTSVATVYAKPTATTTYTVLATSPLGCKIFNTSTVTVYVPTFNAATVSNNFTFCSQGTSSISLPVNVTSGATALTWSYSTTKIGTYTDFTTATNVSGYTFTPSTSLPNTTLSISGISNSGYNGPAFFRLYINNGTCIYNYEIQLFDVKGQGGSVLAPFASQTALCIGSSTILNMGTLNAGIPINWEKSTDNVTFVSAGSSTSTFTTAALSSNTYFRAVFATSGACKYTSGSTLITVNSTIANTLTSTPVSCTDGVNNITIGASSVTNGIYRWQRSVTSPSTGFNDIAAGTNQNYTLNRNLVSTTTWYRRNASTASCNLDSSLVVSIYAPITNNVISTASATSYCVTAPSILLSGAAPVGGDGAYVYRWESSTDGSNYSTISGATAQNYTTTAQTVTMYYRRMITSGGCALSTSAAIIIARNANPVVTVSPTSGNICGGNSISLVASGAASYSWSPATDLSTSTGSTTTSTLTANRTYVVTGTSSFGCTATASTVLTFTAAPAVSTVSATSITVCAMPYNLTALVTSGGTNEWFTAPSPISTYLVAAPSAVTQPGTYYVFSKSGSCYSASSVAVTITLSNVNAPVVNATSINLCSPAMANLVSLQPSAATGTILEWHTGSTSGSPIVSTPASAGAGTYYLFAKSINGSCYGAASSAVTVVINALPVTTVSTNPAAVCFPSTINLNNFNTTGNGTFTYQWYSVSSNPTPSTLVNIPTDVNSAGNYFLFATNAAGCKGNASSPLAVAINSKPTAAITAPVTLCAGNAININTSTNASGPVYVWKLSTNRGATYNTISNSGIYSGATSSTLAISNSTGLDGYQYKYDVTSSANCTTESDNVIVSVDGIVSLNAQPSNYTAIVNGSAIFKITTTGSPTVNYQWKVSTDGGIFYLNVSDGSTYQGSTTPDLVVQSAPAGFNGYKYKCEISNNCTAATNSSPATLSINLCTTATVGGSVSGNTSVCAGTNSTLLTLNGHNGSILYWERSNDNFVTDPIVINNTTTLQTASNLSATTQYRAVIQSGGCASANSIAATITVSPASAGGTLAGSATVCTGSNSTTLTLSGYTGSIVKWQSSSVSNFITSTDIVNITPSLTASNLGATTYYRAVIQSGSCATAYSATGTVTVNPASVGGTIAGSATVCTGFNSSTLTLSEHIGSIIKWQSSTNGFTTVVDIVNTTNTLTATNLNATTQYRAVVQNGSCAIANSSAITIMVNPASVGGFITGSTTVCTGTNSVLLTLNGQTGSIIRWESSLDNFATINIIGNTTNTLTATMLTTTTFYRAVVQSEGCATAVSAVLTVTVSAASVGGIIAGSSSVCSGSNTSLLTLSGHTGSIIKWQSSTDGFTTSIDIANTTTTVSATNLNVTTQYRAIVQSGSCASANSAAATIIVTPASAGGSIAGSASICSGSNSITLILNGQTGSIIKWQSSTDGFATSTDIANTTTTLTATNLNITTLFRAIVQSGSCSSVNSTTATIIVNPASVGGSVAGSAIVCTGTNYTNLTLSGYTGNVVKWQSSADGFVTSTDIANTTNTLAVTNLSATTQFRAVVQSGSCINANSAAATVTVNPASMGGSIAGSASVCTGTNSTILTLSGHTGSILKWQWSTDGFATSTDIANTTTILAAVNLSATTQYRAVVQNESCASANSSSTTVTVNISGAWIGGSNGDWNNATNWCGGIPNIPSNVNIPSGSTITIGSGVSYAQNINIQAGGKLVLSGTGSLVISEGGTLINNGIYDATASTTGVISFAGSGSISGTWIFTNIETSGALDFGTGSIINGEFTLLPGGSVLNNPPTYVCPGSTLIYRNGNTVIRGLEWTTSRTGAGYPSNVRVRNNTKVNFPVLGPGFVCNDLTIDAGSALNQNFNNGSAPLTVARDVIISGSLTLGALPGGDITLGRNWTRNPNAEFIHNNRTVIFNSNSNSVITAPILDTTRNIHGAFGGEIFYKVQMDKASISASLTLAAHISIIKELNLKVGSLNLSNSDVVLVSKDDTTAAVAPIPTVGGVISGVAINYSGTGKFVVQRHLLMGNTSASRRWRLLTTPLSAIDAPTINQAWQEGVSNNDKNNPIDPWPGFGTTITKSTVYNPADGYDQGSTNNASIYYPGTNGTAFQWSVLPTMHTPITAYEGYIIFARGNRSIVVSTPSINANSTVLEPRGRINTGNITKSFITGYQVFGNPYASTINFNNLAFNNYKNSGNTYNNVTANTIGGIGITYYLWDPKTSGSSNVGKWITCSSNGDGTYTLTPNTTGLPEDGTIQSSAAFMMNADTTSGNITFHETDKVAESSSNGIASRGAGANDPIASLKTLLMVGTGNNATISEGVVSSYHSTFNNVVDAQDAQGVSMFNTADAIRIKSQGKMLAIERRNEVADNDTIFLNLQSTSKKMYSLQFKPTNMSQLVTAFLQDKFNGTSTAISMVDTTKYNFEITADVKSAETDRFRIVFKTVGVLPITFSSIKAIKQNNNIAVQWNVENEANVRAYDVEKSVNGREFKKVNTTIATGNNYSVVNYNWLDANGFSGDNYYRIKSISNNGATDYSKVVKVALQGEKAQMAVYPNPVQDAVIGLQLKDVAAGSYNLVLTNSMGQVVDVKTIKHTGGSAAINIKTAGYLSSGNYNLEITGTGFKQSIKVLVQATQ